MHPTSNWHQIQRDSENIFLLWEGRKPPPWIMTQIRVCLRCLKRFQPHAKVYLFSNVLQYGDIDISGVDLMQWTPQELCELADLTFSSYLYPRNWAIWSDLFRVACLWLWGGSYFDVDDLLVRSLPDSVNVMASAYLSPDQLDKWNPNLSIDGRYGGATTEMANSRFRFGADPMINFSSRNPFLKQWLTQLPSAPQAAWGQILPTSIFAGDPDWAAKYVHPQPWPDLLYHPYDNGHNQLDTRYEGDLIRAADKMDEHEFDSCWETLLSHYRFPLLKNHCFSQHLIRGSPRTLLSWAVHRTFKTVGEAD